MPRVLIYLVSILLALGMLFVSYFNELTRFYEDISGITQLKLSLLTDNQLEKIANKKIFINFPNKSQQYFLSEIGIKFNKNKEREIDTSRFNKFKESLEKDLQYLTLYPNINLEKNEFYILGNGSNIYLDEEKFLSEITLENIINAEELRISPKFKENFSLKQNIEANQLLIDKMTKNPLQIKIGRQVFNLDSNRLKTLTTTYENENKKQVVVVDKNKVQELLLNIKSTYKLPAEFNLNEASQKLISHLMFRLTEEVHSKTLVLPITSSHTLSPDLHQKFIEVNKSNQRAYLFENGKLIRELVISTGVTWETPTGNFKVLNKVPMTISYSRIWYMPWYLPIGTINGPYYFGFHEIPYQVNYNGMIYSRDPETIGSPATGGCIQVLKGQAKEIYDWADVGMPVYITENK